MNALIIFAELQSPKANLAMNFLKDLRKSWGTENFDNAWKKKTGEELPDVLSELRFPYD
ncbi:MAG: hypothetical protein GY795_48300 [Desulfobacterales bacterium]|nr:hypothetical protein [Desulfobacterales bacterium]